MTDSAAKCIAKICGADVELGNFIVGLPGGGNCSAPEASRALLREIDGIPGSSAPGSAGGGGVGWSYGYGGAYWVGPSSTVNAQDWGRKFLTNGGCAYIDLDHLEICLPEVRSAFDYVAAWHAMLHIVRDAWRAANEKLPAGQHLRAVINNSDGLSHSYGSHLNLLVTRRAWENIFNRRLHYQMFLAAAQVSSIIFTGQGKVGSENGTPHVDFQIAQRADFMETTTGLQTTYNRPLVNSRDESLCGLRSDEMARLHVIFFDAAISPHASLLRAGMMQIVLAMIEAEEVSLDVLLDDPLAAVRQWSRDATLTERAPLTSGGMVTAAELQLRIIDEAARFVARGGCDDVVPRVGEILALWRDTVEKLHACDLDALAPRLDWVRKKQILERARARRADLDWKSSALRYLDQAWGSIDPEEGLYWSCENAGGVEAVVDAERIARLVHAPPDDTRAWTRATLLRLAGAARVQAVDWDRVTLRHGPHGYESLSCLDLDDPRGPTRADIETLCGVDATLEEIHVALAGWASTDEGRRLQ